MLSKLIEITQNAEEFITSDNSHVLVNQYITIELEKLTPHIPILSEENEVVPYSIRQAWDTFWLINTFDGFSINIALIKGDRPIMSVINVPTLYKIYFAEKDSGAFVIDNSGIQQLRITNLPPQKIVCSRAHLNKKTQEFIDQFSFCKIILAESSLKFLYIAENKAMMYPQFGPTMEWETAAADFIVQESGGITCDLDGNPLKYNKESLLNPQFIVLYAKDALF